MFECLMVRSSNTHQKRQLRYICRQIATQKCHKQWHESVTSYRCSKAVIKQQQQLLYTQILLSYRCSKAVIKPRVIKLPCLPQLVTDVARLLSNSYSCQDCCPMPCYRCSKAVIKRLIVMYQSSQSQRLQM